MSKLALVFVAVAAALATPAVATEAAVRGFAPDQPFASFWFPNELLSWTPEADRDAPYNRSGVPLAERFLDRATRVNRHARPEARVASLAVMYPSTSFNPSQGALSFDTYAFSYWQYLDVLVFWGGSAGEGLILAPNGGVIDAAHRNGVRVLGNIFFPPNVFGGDIQWVRDLVQRDGSTFPVADKLIEVAEYYGFDGWFINQETSGGGSGLASDIRDFVRYIHERSDLEVQWYDAMTESGAIFYQNALTSSNDAFLQEGGRVSDSMFLNYFWSSPGLTSSRELALSLGRSPYDLYAGVDVGLRGFETSVNWSGLFPEDEPHKLSLGFFGTQWTHATASSPEEFYRQANHFWVGPGGDPSRTDIPGWFGVAHYVPAKSPIVRVPFVTHFNPGNGHRFSVDGEVLREGGWNNRALSDVLPTWRYIVRGAPLEPSIDFDLSYYGGASLGLSGALDGSSFLALYKTRLDIETTTAIDVAYRTADPVEVSVGVAFLEDGALSPFQYRPLGEASGDWELSRVELDEAAGQVLGAIGLRVTSVSPVADLELHVGRIAVVDSTAPAPRSPSRVRIESQDELSADLATLRLRWDASSTAAVAYHYVYRRDPDGGRTFLGASTTDAYFVAELVRAGDETETVLEVVAIGDDFQPSEAATTLFFWSDR